VTLAFVYGTRPEAIKGSVVVVELRALDVPVQVVCSGQHVELLKGTPAETDLKDGISLGLASSGNVGKWIGTAVPAIKRALQDVGATACAVQGDTASAYAGAIAAALLDIPVHHIEAGIRSHTLREPSPEELLRTRISQRASWHYAPTELCRRNLYKEGISDSRVLVTGNSVVSALARYAPDVKPDAKPLNSVLVTMHRREWLQRGAAHVCATVNELIRAASEHLDVIFTWPMHPAVQKVLGRKVPWMQQNLIVIEPLPYPRAALLLSCSLGVITDSGGLQEEAATLGVPCAVMRNVSDRPESIDLGLAKLFPPTPEGVREAVSCILERKLPRKPSDCYGTVEAASKIAEHIASTLKRTPIPAISRPEAPLPIT
jgi:UDP-N-acetylglucosamine 2-epimerase (non-hydrolysing)